MTSEQSHECSGPIIEQKHTEPSINSQIDFNNPEDKILKQIPSISPQIALNSISMNQAASCGYCNGSKKTKFWVTSGFYCQMMGILEYKMLLDRGWRRSGTYYYRPSVAQSCCQAFTIRLDTSEFKIRRFQHKVLKKIKKIKLQNDLDCLQNQATETISQKTSQSQIQQQIQIQQTTPNHDQKEEEETDKEDELRNQIHKTIKYRLELMTCKLTDIFLSLQLDPEYNLKSIDSIIFTTLIKSINRFSVYKSQSSSTYRIGCNIWAMFYAILGRQLKTDFGIKLMPINKNQYFRENIIKPMKLQDDYPFQIDTEGQLHFMNDEITRRLEKRFPSIIQKIGSTKKSQKCHKLKIHTIWVRAEFSKESFDLYCRYQKHVHSKDNCSKESYVSFLCQQSLQNVNILSTNGQSTLKCGCWHIKYYLQGKLVSVGVVDVMPDSMSSVYFFYDPAYRRYSLGVYGVLCEIEFMNRMQKSGHFQFRHYYLGFYIQDIPKMNYKGEYQPSEILCPATFQWIKLKVNTKESLIKQTQQKIEKVESMVYFENTSSITSKSQSQKYTQSDNQYDIIKQNSQPDTYIHKIVLEDMIVAGIDENFLRDKVRLVRGGGGIEQRLSIFKRPSHMSYFTNLFSKFLPLVGTNLMQRFQFVYN